MGQDHSSLLSHVPNKNNSSASAGSIDEIATNMRWPQIFGLLGHIYEINTEAIKYTKERAVATWVETYLAEHVDHKVVPSHDVSRAIERILTEVNRQESEHSETEDSVVTESFTLEEVRIDENEPLQEVDFEVDFKLPDNNTVISFDDTSDTFACLSNAASSPFEYKSKVWDNVDALYHHLSPANPTKIDVMKICLTQKFQDNEALKIILLSTGTKTLSYNSPDPFWGAGEERAGQNHLGLLLMELRVNYANELSISEI